MAATEEGDNTSIVPAKDLQYNSHLEHLISSEAEKALVLYWLHDQAEKRYSRFSTSITLPVIVMSTLAGSASIGKEVLFGDGNGANIVIGLISISVAILNTVTGYFGWAKRAEGHRISSINYAKMHRWISIELALPRDQRVPAKHFLKEIRGQIDRLNETSPSIPPHVIILFEQRVKNLKEDVSLPEICNNITAVHVYPEDDTRIVSKDLSAQTKSDIKISFVDEKNAVVDLDEEGQATTSKPAVTV